MKKSDAFPAATGAALEDRPGKKMKLNPAAVSLVKRQPGQAESFDRMFRVAFDCLQSQVSAAFPGRARAWLFLFAEIIAKNFCALPHIERGDGKVGGIALASPLASGYSRCIHQPLPHYCFHYSTKKASAVNDHLGNEAFVVIRWKEDADGVRASRDKQNWKCSHNLPGSYYKPFLRLMS